MFTELEHHHAVSCYYWVNQRTKSIQITIDKIAKCNTVTWPEAMANHPLNRFFFPDWVSTFAREVIFFNLSWIGGVLHRERPGVGPLLVGRTCRASLVPRDGRGAKSGRNNGRCPFRGKMVKYEEYTGKYGNIRNRCWGILFGKGLDFAIEHGDLVRHQVKPNHSGHGWQLKCSETTMVTPWDPLGS